MRLLSFAVAFSSILTCEAFVSSPSGSSAPRLAAQTELKLSSTVDATGTVKWYNAERGFGFIAVDDGGPDMYVHATGLSFEGPLSDGDRVSFATTIDRRTNKPKAVSVVRSKTSDEKPAEEPVVIVNETPMTDIEIAPVEVLHLHEESDEAAIQEKSRQASKNQQALLEARFAMENKAKEKAASVEKSIQSEKNQRTLLEARFAIDKKAKEAAASLRKSTQSEKNQRTLLEARFAMEKRAKEGSASLEKSIQSEKSQRALLEARLGMEQKLKMEAREAAAVAKTTRVERNQRALLQARFSMELEIKAKAKEEAARRAKEEEDKRIAEEAESAQALELGYPSAAVMKARMQPQPEEVETALAKKYGAMDIEERAFNILADLGMIDLHSDPDDLDEDDMK